MNIYIRRLFNHDVDQNRQISFTKEVAACFFNLPQDFLERKKSQSIHIFHFNNDKVFADIDLQPSTDYRFSNRLNNFLKENGDVMAVDDLLYVERVGKSYGVKLIKKSDLNYAVFAALLNAEDRHFLLCTDESETQEPEAIPDTPLQQIFYGAPGTGKSHGVKEETDAWEKAGRVVRTTFHPDSDYSTFVGAYKPTMEYLPVRNSSGLFVKKNGSTTTEASESDIIREKQITYSFVPQAFLQAYVAAWSDQSKPEYLVIEEINRGNCAQIFGDLFQLLDRADNGYSEYPVRADKDLEAYLKEAFERNGVVLSNYPKVQSGEELCLPSNLLIRATMNTSDQSLFPIDSAFKRRWDWQYVPIHDAGEGYQIEVAGNKYEWWSFVKKINERILKTTSSEDKQLGYFFCKAKDGKVISAETFVSKVVFYLWNDVFKDYEFGDDAFNDDSVDGKPHKLEFRDFYEAGEKGKPVVVTEKIEKFFSNLGLTPLKSGSGNAAEEAVLEDDTSEFIETDFEDEKKKDTSKYSVNGVGAFQKTYLAYEVMKLFVKNNPEMSADEIVSSWEPFTGIFKNIVVSEDNYNSYIDASNDPRASKRYIDVMTANDEMVYVSTQWNLDRLNAFSDKLNELNWPYTITKVEE